MSVRLQTMVSEKTAALIRDLSAALEQEFGVDFSYRINAKGHVVAASNRVDGQITPKIHELQIPKSRS